MEARWPAYWVSALGVAQGCERWDLSARLFGWVSGRVWVRWCQGLGCRGGGPGGGCTVLSGGGRGLVLPGGHGRVGGMVAWVWRSVAIEAISRLKHENVVQLLGYWVEGDEYVLAYEYTSGGTLHDILLSKGKKGVWGAKSRAALSWMQRVKIALSAAEGLEFLHHKEEPQVTHGNIISSNILLFDNDIAKVGNVGTANVLVREDIDSCHSFRQILDTHRIIDGLWFHQDDYHVDVYAATGQCNKKSDVYAFGAVLLELLTGRKAVDHTLPHGRQSLVTWLCTLGEKGLCTHCDYDPFLLAYINSMKDNVLTKASFSEDNLQRCVDPRLEGDYPRNAVTKGTMIHSLASRASSEAKKTGKLLHKKLLRKQRQSIHVTC
uniref:Serine/threonine-protein kinase PBS1 n=1 Tax=Aegilops tauschii TaxID=37682 RepID=M8C8P7_AEGTA